MEPRPEVQLAHVQQSHRLFNLCARGPAVVRVPMQCALMAVAVVALHPEGARAHTLEKPLVKATALSDSARIKPR